MCHAVGQRMTGVRPGSFSNEHRMKCHTHAIGDRGRRRTTKRSARACACSGACSSPVVVLLPRLLSACSFLRNADFMGFSGRVAIKSSVLYRDEAKNASRCKRQLHFRKFGESKKAIDLLPFDAKTNPRIHPLWRL